MGTTLHSFRDIFETEFDVGTDKIKLKQIAIPMIQRDYAQGRIDSDIGRVRTRFLSSLYDAIVKNEAITLDFIYGDIDGNGVMTPLDGQQRLTTLFLLHWYAAQKKQLPKKDYSFLGGFSYETRYSARHFCSNLIGFQPTLNTKISEEIINQSWFPLDWLKDPTISSMLVMLDSIDDQFKNVPDIWEKLLNKTITFYFLPIKDMGLTDELYIKMNSRGKPLTSFEHFKAELERNMREIDEKKAVQIINKIDRDWTDLLWKYRNSDSKKNDDNIIDDEFLRYFKFICDIICYRNNESPQRYSNDEFDLLQKYYSVENKDSINNITTLETFFDCWRNIEGFSNPTDFLTSFMSSKHEKGKIVVDSRNAIDIFEDCLHSYSDKTGRIRQFPLNRIVLMYAITVYLQNQTKVSNVEFSRRIRIVNNLIQNSEDQISDRLDRNRIPAIIKEVDTIILTGVIDDRIVNSFNTNQLTEEKEKIAFLSEHPESADTLFELEDHPMLKGQISIIGLENLTYTNRFESLFNCDLDKIDCALMSIGNYSQTEQNKWRYQFASNKLKIAWDKLFHKSSNSGFENTKSILKSLLDSNQIFANEILDNIASVFTQKCETDSIYPWRYYYVKYPAFRPGSYGKLSNKDTTKNPYLFLIMKTESQESQNTYIPYLKIADREHLPRDEMKTRLVYGDQYIYCLNDAYLLCKLDGGKEKEIERITISQNDKGFDTEDRIIKLQNYLKAKQL